RCHECCVTINPSAKRADALNGRARFHESDIFRQHFGCEATQWCDVVDDPDAAAMRGNYEIVVARMDGEVAHRNRRHVSAFVSGPVRATIQGNPKTELGTKEKEVLVGEIFLDDVGVA